jgi:hypothetical protein
MASGGLYICESTPFAFLDVTAQNLFSDSDVEITVVSVGEC